MNKKQTFQPQYEHDCQQCKFLGGTPKSFDYYFCEQSGLIPTVIARTGADNHYYSGLGVIKSIIRDEKSKNESLDVDGFLSKLIDNTTEDIQGLALATKLAIEQGYLDLDLNSTHKKTNKIKP